MRAAAATFIIAEPRIMSRANFAGEQAKDLIARSLVAGPRISPARRQETSLVGKVESAG